MSTVFDIRNLRLPHLSRAAIVGGSVALVAALVLAMMGLQFYRKLINNSVVAYFSEANALYPGDDVTIMGIKVGAIDKIEAGGDRMKVTFHYNKKYKVPADAVAAIVNPTLVASRNIQLEPPYTSGPVLPNRAVIPMERTAVPAEWDELRNSFSDIIDKLGPTPEQPKGPFGDAIEAFADGLAGKGKQINETSEALSRALTALAEGRGDFSGVVRSLALFVNSLHLDDQKFVALNTNLAQLTSRLTHTDHDLADAARQFDTVLPTLRKFFADNTAPLTRTVDVLADVTTGLVQPEQLEGLERGVLHVLPTALSNANNFYHPANGALLGMTINLAGLLTNNWHATICGGIQAGHRRGYQDSAELCAQYLSPILDAIKMNYMPFTINPFTTAAVLPKHVAYSEPRLHPPPGYKDTTVPGIWVPDTALSHRNTQHGWIVAPGMQGVEVDHVTASLLTPESLAELMGGPDIPPVVSQYETPPGPPNAYNEDVGPLPYVGLPPGQAPIQAPPQPPAVGHGPVAPAPAGPREGPLPGPVVAPPMEPGPIPGGG